MKRRKEKIIPFMSTAPMNNHDLLTKWVVALAQKVKGLGAKNYKGGDRRIGGV